MNKKAVSLVSAFRMVSNNLSIPCFCNVDSTINCEWNGCTEYKRLYGK